MLIATPVRKPIITEWGTNRTYRPKCSSPATTIRPPARSVSRNRACGRSSDETLWSAEPAASAAALVVVITISLLLAVSPPPIGPTMLA